MSSGTPMEFGEHRLETRARDTDLSMVYTIDLAVVDDYTNSVEQFLAGDKYKVVGIDLQQKKCHCPPIPPHLHLHPVPHTPNPCSHHPPPPTWRRPASSSRPAQPSSHPAPPRLLPPGAAPPPPTPSSPASSSSRPARLSSHPAQPCLLLLPPGTALLPPDATPPPPPARRRPASSSSSPARPSFHLEPPRLLLSAGAPPIRNVALVFSTTMSVCVCVCVCVCSQRAPSSASDFGYVRIHCCAV
ncbi:vegetative cell wall protein gp1-like [Triticum urartu]|uniref:vegetative cell wall protein gp1-like n=1 Tax=Triticum urartu TaxID=4572 RepID=UPI002043F7AD|nr:vegetative cell wall protein gp1-like [Triticum urartu]